MSTHGDAPRPVRAGLTDYGRWDAMAEDLSDGEDAEDAEQRRIAQQQQDARRASFEEEERLQRAREERDRALAEGREPQQAKSALPSADDALLATQEQQTLSADVDPETQTPYDEALGALPAGVTLQVLNQGRRPPKRFAAFVPPRAATKDDVEIAIRGRLSDGSFLFTSRPGSGGASSNPLLGAGRAHAVRAIVRLSDERLHPALRHALCQIMRRGVVRLTCNATRARAVAASLLEVALLPAGEEQAELEVRKAMAPRGIEEWPANWGADGLHPLPQAAREAALAAIEARGDLGTGGHGRVELSLLECRSVQDVGAKVNAPGAISARRVAMGKQEDGVLPNNPDTDYVMHVRYVGRLESTGEVICSSPGGGTQVAKPFSLGTGIPPEGLKFWDVLLRHMVLYETADVRVAPEYAYGLEGSAAREGPRAVPPDAVVWFNVEIVDWNRASRATWNEHPLLKLTLEEGCGESCARKGAALHVRLTQPRTPHSLPVVPIGRQHAGQMLGMNLTRNVLEPDRQAAVLPEDGSKALPTEEIRWVYNAPDPLRSGDAVGQQFHFGVAAALEMIAGSMREGERARVRVGAEAMYPAPTPSWQQALDTWDKDTEPEVEFDMELISWMPLSALDADGSAVVATLNDSDLQPHQSQMTFYAAQESLITLRCKATAFKGSREGINLEGEAPFLHGNISFVVGDGEAHEFLEKIALDLRISGTQRMLDETREAVKVIATSKHARSLAENLLSMKKLHEERRVMGFDGRFKDAEENRSAGVDYTVDDSVRATRKFRLSAVRLEGIDDSDEDASSDDDYDDYSDSDWASQISSDDASEASSLWSAATSATGRNPRFIPSRTFVGAMQGYKFTFSEHGLGYYKDRGRPSVRAVMEANAYAEKHFTAPEPPEAVIEPDTASAKQARVLNAEYDHVATKDYQATLRSLEGMDLDASRIELELTVLHWKEMKRKFEMDPEEVLRAAERWRIEANRFYERGDYRRALKKYERALKFVMEDNEHHYDRQVPDKFTGQFRLPALQLKRTFQNNASSAAMKLKDWDRVKKYTNEILKFQPNDTRALYRRGLAHYDGGWLREARTDLKMAAELGCQEAEAPLARVKARLAKQHKKAKKDFGGVFDRMAKQIEAEERLQEKRRREAERAERAAALDRLREERAARDEEGRRLRAAQGLRDALRGGSGEGTPASDAAGVLSGETDAAKEDELDADVVELITPGAKALAEKDRQQRQHEALVARTEATRGSPAEAEAQSAAPVRSAFSFSNGAANVPLPTAQTAVPEAAEVKGAAQATASAAAEAKAKVDVKEAVAPATATRAAPLPAYIPSERFAGARDGYVYKTADSGVGYYRLESGGNVTSKPPRSGLRGGWLPPPKQTKGAKRPEEPIVAKRVESARAKLAEQAMRMRALVARGMTKAQYAYARLGDRGMPAELAVLADLAMSALFTLLAHRMLWRALARLASLAMFAVVLVQHRDFLSAHGQYALVVVRKGEFRRLLLWSGRKAFLTPEQARAANAKVRAQTKRSTVTSAREAVEAAEVTERYRAAVEGRHAEKSGANAPSGVAAAPPEEGAAPTEVPVRVVQRPVLSRPIRFAPAGEEGDLEDFEGPSVSVAQRVRAVAQ